MKKLYNLLVLPAVALCALACQDDVTRTESPAFNEDAIQVCFPSTNPSSIELVPTDKSFTIEVSREQKDAAASVKLKLQDASGCFSIPETVDFEAGKNTSTIEVSIVKELTPFQDNFIVISVADDNAVNPYVSASVPEVAMHIVCSDFKVIGKGVFTSEFWEDEWEQEILYSEIKDAYRFVDLYDTGYPFEITIGADGSINGGVKTNYGQKFDVLTYSDGRKFSLSFLMGSDNLDASYYDAKTKSIRMYAYVYFFDDDPWNYANCYEYFTFTEGDIVRPAAE